jgi:4-oxalocrotonate tautomerase
MPVITIEGPRIPDLDTKRHLVQEVTDAAVEAFGLGRDSIIVILHETSPECVATGGELVCDRHVSREPSAGQAGHA